MPGSVTIQEATLIGRIIFDGQLIGSINSNANLVGALSAPVSYEEYAGPYTVVPKISEQSLSTSDKHLSNDISVQAIPYYEVSNINGGLTVIIGGI